MWSPAGESHVGANSKGVQELSCGASFLIVALCLAQGDGVEPSWGKPCRCEQKMCPGVVVEVVF